MTERKGGLGRGLAALIPSGPPPGSEPVGTPANGSPATATQDGTQVDVEVAGAVYREVPVGSISPRHGRIWNVVGSGCASRSDS